MQEPHPGLRQPGDLKQALVQMLQIANAQIQLVTADAIDNLLRGHRQQAELQRRVFLRQRFNQLHRVEARQRHHADPQTVKTTKLAFVTLPKAIKWGDTEVQLVVLLAIAEKNMSEAKELIASIYDLFNSPEEIRWVVSSKNREELYRKLVKGGTPNVF